jgi:hypothetical protein
MKFQDYVQRLRRNDASLRSLHLNNEDIDDDGAAALAQELQVNTSLQELHLNDNEIGDAGAVALALALQVNTSLQMLFLSDNCIGDSGATALAQALPVQKSLRGLYLTNNSIGDSGAAALAQALQVNKSLQELNLGNNEMSDEGGKLLLETLEKYNGTLFELSLFTDTKHHLQRSIHVLVSANKNKTRKPPPRPRKSSELFFQVLQDIQTTTVDDDTIQEGSSPSIVPQLEAVLQFMSHLLELSVFYTTVSAHYQLGVLDVNERNRLLCKAMEMGRQWCTSADATAFYKLALDKAHSDGIINVLQKYKLEAHATVTLVEHAYFTQAIKQALPRKQKTSDANNTTVTLVEHVDFIQAMKQGILRSNTDPDDTENWRQMLESLQDQLQIVNSNGNDRQVLEGAMLHKKRVEAGVTFVSAILNVLQGAANLTIGDNGTFAGLFQVIDFGDLRHIQNVLTNVQAMEQAAETSVSDLIQQGQALATQKADQQLDDAVTAPNPIVLVTAFSTLLGQSSTRPRVPDHQVAADASAVFDTFYTAQDSSDTVVYPDNDHSFAAHELDQTSKEKVLQASLERMDLENKQLPVFAAIFHGHISDVEKELKRDNVDLDRRDSRNRTCADFAAVMGRLDMVQLIEDKGGQFVVSSRPNMMALARERYDVVRNGQLD